MLKHPSLTQAEAMERDSVQNMQAEKQTPAAPAYNQPVANFNLVPLANRTNERAPHYYGSFKLDGVWYSVTTWIQYSRTNGEQMLNSSVTPMNADQDRKSVV